MDDLSGQLQAFLSQPDAMEQVAAMAKQLGLGPGQEARPPETGGLSPELIRSLSGVMEVFQASDEASAFLEALGPLLREDRREKLRRAQRALQLTRAAKAAAQTIKL